MPNIKPISDLRNYTEVLKQVDASNRVYLTRNSHGEYGILTMAEIDELDRYRAAYPLMSRLRIAEERADAVIREMTKEFRTMQQFENKEPSVENLIGIPCDYRMLYVQHNYAFYRIEENAVRITDIFHEREDFMWKLSGVKTTTRETEDYWGE